MTEHNQMPAYGPPNPYASPMGTGELGKIRSTGTPARGWVEPWPCCWRYSSAS